MVSSTSTPIPFASWTPESPEARRLAVALRECRLSFLSGEAGAGKTRLIVAGLMPLLRRRSADGAIGVGPRESSVIMPFPERRSSARARLAELVVYFDRWDDAPLIGLQRAIDAAVQAAGGEAEPGIVGLPDRVKGLADRYGTGLLLVLDQFESFLDRWNPAESNAFVDELARLINRRLPAHVLIALRSESEPALKVFGERLFVGDAEMFVLPRGQEVDAVPTEAVGRSPTQRAAAPDVPPPPRLRIVPRLTETVTVSPAVPQEAHRQAPPSPTQTDPAEDRSQPAMSISPILRAPRRPRPPMSTRIRFFAVVILVALLSMSTYLLAPPMRGAPPGGTDGAIPATTLSSSTERPLQNPTNPPPPEIELHVDAEQGVTPRLPTELARALGADGAVDLRIMTQGSAAAAGAHLSVVRYDALSAVAGQTYRPSGIAVIGPLYTEELFVVVRADSPLRSIDQLEGRRINVGPEFGDRALTASTVYRRMFGKSPPPSRNLHLGAVEALEQLARGAPLDAVLMVEPQPSATLNALPAAVRRALKLLPLDPAAPASRRLLQAYLPATLRGASVTGTTQAKPVPTVSAVAFLVSHGKPDEAGSNALVKLVDSFCRVLPKLKRDGDPKWRELRAGQQLETGWPVLLATDAAWGRCAEEASPNRTNLPPTSKGEHS